MDEIKTYHTTAMRVRVEGDVAVVYFKPHNELPVEVQMSKDVLRRFLLQAGKELEGKIPD